MGYHIKEIVLSKDRYVNYKIHGTAEMKIDDLSKINILVGTNNSGKSRMLRSLFTEKDLLFFPASFNLPKLNEAVKNFKNKLISVLDSKHILGYGILKKDNIEHLTSYKFIKDSDDFLSSVYELIDYAKNLSGTQSITSSGLVNFVDHNAIQVELKKIATEFEVELVGIFSEKRIDFKRVYIPTLRGLRGFEDNQNYYLTRTQKDYFPGDESLEIFTGLELYEEVKNLLLGNLKDREKIMDFQKFIGDSFFEGQEVALIPNVKSDVLFVKIGTEKEYPIYNLGDGIQSLIILTFPLFKYKGENLLFFIEEPELYLHPGMQRKFLEIITHKNFDGYQYFLTTHSNHFLDMTLDMDKMSIYSFNKELEDVDSREKNATFIIENVSNEDDNVLKMLGVKNSAVFLSNCTIWVEGITDRYYIRHFLNLYQETLDKFPVYKEDIHYSFVEYSGNNITHWSFLDENENEDEEIFKSINESRVCGTLFLITDKDSKKKETRQSKLAQALGERYYCLECREIENILTATTLKKVIASYEKVKVSELKFTKNFSSKTYRDELLGRFIEKVIRDKNRQGSYSSTSGAVSDKIGFCKRAISEMKSFEDLSEEAQKLSIELYEFIAANN
ncbi:hypothetical protein BBI11_16195 [Planococcus maritimus]|uniref:AAA family ATPase n=1 Tax=Planococcus maritimus TaxID=192421 RepID=UPI00080F15E6|nr:AAA family ATPase [Planococcus maritimus]ANU18481.1 hypothetical protein BBI11_16195 [Planococcus maritimus]